MSELNAVPEVPEAMEPMPSEIERIEHIVRCDGVDQGGFPCGRFLTKLIFIISLSPAFRQSGVSISQLIPGLEIKVGTQTKCRKCKKMFHTLNVV